MGSPGLVRHHVTSTHSSTRLRLGVEDPSPGDQTGGEGRWGQGTGSERHSSGNTWGNIPRLGRCLSTAVANCNARVKGNHGPIVDGSLGMSTSVTNGGYYLKVKQVATVDADQDVVIKARAARQINRGITDISALNRIRLEGNGGGMLIDQAGNVSTTMGLTGPTQALGAPFGLTSMRKPLSRPKARRARDCPDIHSASPAEAGRLR